MRSVCLTCTFDAFSSDISDSNLGVVIKRLPLVARSAISLVASRGKGVELSDAALSLVVEFLEVLCFLERAASRRDGAN